MESAARFTQRLGLDDDLEEDENHETSSEEEHLCDMDVSSDTSGDSYYSCETVDEAFDLV